MMRREVSIMILEQFHLSKNNCGDVASLTDFELSFLISARLSL